MPRATHHRTHHTLWSFVSVPVAQTTRMFCSVCSTTQEFFVGAVFNLLAPKGQPTDKERKDLIDVFVLVNIAVNFRHRPSFGYVYKSLTCATLFAGAW